MKIRDAQLTDTEFARLVEIYNPYIRDTVITFEEETLSAAAFGARIREKTEAGFPWLLAEDHNTVLGYAYAGPWGTRSAFRYSVETAIYLDQPARGTGIGTALYTELFARLKHSGYHTAIAGITLPNPASQALHEKFGMTQVAHYTAVGYKFDRWLDLGYWQVILNPDPKSR